MKLGQLNHLVTLAANLGVLASILFLAYEIQQNNKQLALQSYQAWISANLEIDSNSVDPVLSQIIAEGNLDSRNLTKDTYVAFAMQSMSIMQMAQSANYLYQQRALDRELWEAEMSRAAGILALPGVRQWWDAGGKSQLTPSFVELLESTESDIDIWNWDEERGYFTDDGLRDLRLRN